MTSFLLYLLSLNPFNLILRYTSYDKIPSTYSVLRTLLKCPGEVMPHHTLTASVLLLHPTNNSTILSLSRWFLPCYWAICLDPQL